MITACAAAFLDQVGERGWEKPALWWWFVEHGGQFVAQCCGRGPQPLITRVAVVVGDEVVAQVAVGEGTQFGHGRRCVVRVSSAA
ncbi:hypothetical protein [Nocardia sp. NPDC004750]